MKTVITHQLFTSTRTLGCRVTCHSQSCRQQWPNERRL